MSAAYVRLAWGGGCALLFAMVPVGHSQAADPFGLEDHLPQVRFDVPQQLAAREQYRVGRPAPERLMEVTVPVSFRLVSGDIHRVEELVIEIDASQQGLRVHDFAPRTQLAAELADKVEIVTTRESAAAVDASLGGQLPIPAANLVAHVAPTLSTGKKEREVQTTTENRLAPKRAITVSGTLGQSQGVFFHLRPSSQTTLEGQHLLKVVFQVPEEWQEGAIEVRCWARGEKKLLWFDKAKVWGRLSEQVAIKHTQPLPSAHRVAKPPTK